jgi:hypothetical protein
MNKTLRKAMLVDHAMSQLDGGNIYQAVRIMKGVRDIDALLMNCS